MSGEQTTEFDQIGPTIERHLSTGLGCRCGGWKLDTSRRPVDPRAQHREHVAEVLDALLAERIDAVIDAIEETFLGQLPSKALTYCAQEDVNAGLDALRERFLGRDDR